VEGERKEHVGKRKDLLMEKKKRVKTRGGVTRLAHTETNEMLAKQTQHGATKHTAKVYRPRNPVRGVGTKANEVRTIRT